MMKVGFKPVSQVAAVVCCWLFSLHVNALEFTIGQKDINRFVKMAFPYKQSYQGADVFFSDPDVTLDGLNNEIRINTLISAYKDNRILKAKATISGELLYDAIDYNLQIKEPSIREFKVLENGIDDAQQLIRGIRDVVGQSLPIIVLLDLDKFDVGFGKIQPKSIVVGNKKLVITL
ncbi:hypothetical protein [Alteromonas facilis]|uniref:hypothetical protein n=1 Tax=Alteromonas facilis TaxID=2048004 RepID=UPI000F5D19B8|nr:hypothetical protein [Alteromonas facilis]